MARIETLRLKVVGEQLMHCNGCENAIQNSLSRLPGVRRVKADHKTQLVEVSADVEQTGPEAIRERLHQMGYEAVLE